MPLHVCYAESGWRYTTPVDVVTQCIGVGLVVAGEQVRFRLDLASARQLQESLAERLIDHALQNYFRQKSSSSDGKPSVTASPA